MGNLLNPDNLVMQLLSKVFDLIILNLLFILTCVPLITIGASISALHYVSLKIVRGEDPYILQNYWKAFRSNFKQSTLIWLLLLAVFIFLGVDYKITGSQDTALFSVIRTGLWIISLVVFCIFIYIFPVVSHFVCTTKQAVKNSVLMAFGHLPFTLLLFLMYGIVLFLCTFSVQTMAFAVAASGICGFSVISLLTCIIFNRIFRRYEPEEEKEQEA